MIFQGAEQTGHPFRFQAFSYVIIEEGQGAFEKDMIGNKDGKLRPFA